LKKQARATAAGGRARCHGWLEWRSHRLPSLVKIILSWGECSPPPPFFLKNFIILLFEKYRNF